MTDGEGREAHLRVRGLRRAYSDFSLGPIDLSLDRGETLVVLGPNGSGKTTLLRVLAGLEPMGEGEVILGGRDVGKLPAHRRGIGMVFQDLALFPTRSVWDNITYGLVVQRWDRRTAETRGEELLGQFHLRHLADRSPGELSGGERQRVALARALAPRPSLLLLDEPLSSADPRVARELRVEIKGYLKAAETPAIYVTHDFDEAFFLGHRVALIDRGRWVQEGPSQEVFDHPATPFAAWFLGYNVLSAEEGGQGSIGVLPQSIRLMAPGTPGTQDGIVESRGETGAETRLFVRLSPVPPVPPGGPKAPEGPLVEVLQPREAGRPVPAPGDRVGLAFTRQVGLTGSLPPGGFKKEGVPSGEEERR